MSNTYDKQNNIVGIIVAGFVLAGMVITGSFFVWDANSTASQASEAVVKVEKNVKLNTDAIKELQHVDEKRDKEMEAVKGELKYHGDILRSIATKVGAEIPIKDPIQ